MTIEAWQWLASESLLDIRPWLEVLRSSVRLPDGRHVDDFYTVRLPAYTVIAALTPDGRFVAERHYRPGVRRETLTMPSGFLEPDESPLAGAQRELLEETGYQSSHWQALGRFTVDGNRGCGVAHLYLAREAQRVREPQANDLAEIRIELLSPPDFQQELHAGGAAELASAAAFGLALLHLHD